jgi:hypothetical protein
VKSNSGHFAVGFYDIRKRRLIELYEIFKLLSCSSYKITLPPFSCHQQCQRCENEQYDGVDRLDLAFQKHLSLPGVMTENIMLGYKSKVLKFVEF